MAVKVFNGEPIDVTVDGVSVTYGQRVDLTLADLRAAWDALQSGDLECHCDQCLAAMVEEASGEVRH